jgi:hypothetical protein
MSVFFQEKGFECFPLPIVRQCLEIGAQAGAADPLEDFHGTFHDVEILRLPCLYRNGKGGEQVVVMAG